MIFVPKSLTERSTALTKYAERVSSENGLMFRGTLSGVIFFADDESKYRRRTHASCSWKNKKLKIKADDTPDPASFNPTEEERAAIESELLALRPEATAIPLTKNKYPAPDQPYMAVPPITELPAKYLTANRKARDGQPHYWSEFFDPKPDGDLVPGITLIEIREDQEDGDKAFHRLAYVQKENGSKEWAVDFEPEERLLWGLDQLTADITDIWVFEGTKAAMTAKGMPSVHPWYKTLHGADNDNCRRNAFLGAPGGALSWLTLNLDAIDKKRFKVHLIADCDVPGREFMRGIAKRLPNPSELWIYQIEHAAFCYAWDFGDEMPKELFKNGRYSGPRLEEFKVFGGWLTEIVHMVPSKTKSGTPKPIFDLTERAKKEFVFVASEESIYLRSNPSKEATSVKIFDDVYTAARHTKIEPLLKKIPENVAETPIYDPTNKSYFIIENGTRKFNTFVPSSIPSIEGDLKPFHEFMEHFIPIKKERDHLYRWLATLVGKPSTRLIHALLLASETQGTGKGLFANHICAPLVGDSNYSSPSPTNIKSEFNSWLTRKRLIVVNEIYEGESWKTERELRSYITDKKITERKMYANPTLFDNYAAFIFCSNSLLALKIEDTDRRYFIPRVTETTYSKGTEFIAYLESGGLSAIRYWAENFDNYIKDDERPPQSSRKTEMVEASCSPAERFLIDKFEMAKDKKIITDKGKEIDNPWFNRAIPSWELRRSIPSDCKGREYIDDGKIKKIAVAAGYVDLADYDSKKPPKGRYRINNNRQGKVFILKGWIQAGNIILPDGNAPDNGLFQYLKETNLLMDDGTAI